MPGRGEGRFIEHPISNKKLQGRADRIQ